MPQLAFPSTFCECAPMPRDLSTHPLHFETQPAEGAPEHSDLLGMGMMVAWLSQRGLLSAKLAKTDAAKKLAKREITGRDFLISNMKSTVIDADVDKRVADFLYGYTHRLFLGDDEADPRDNKAVSKLLGLERKEDELAFTDDYLATFKKVVKNPFLIPDSWNAFDRFAPILDARWEDYQKTKFAKPAPKGIYEKAIKARDAVKKLDAIKQAKTTFSIAAAFTDQLLGLVGRSLKDKEVREVLTAAGLKVGKVIDEQALPALGVSYMGSKFDIGGKRELGVSDVRFYNKGVKSYIRGIGAEVTFAAFAGALPKGLAWTDDRAAAKKKVGKPSSESDDGMWWKYPKQDRWLALRFKGKRLTEVAWMMPPDWAEDE